MNARSSTFDFDHDVVPVVMPRIGVTLGDPAGIGPEVAGNALAEHRWWNCESAPPWASGPLPDVEFIVFGPANVVGALDERLGSARVGVRKLSPFWESRGRPSAASGKAALEALDAAIDAAKNGEIDAICTGPLSKEAIALAGSNDRGHTEILSRALGQGPTAMAFFGSKLKVALITAHQPLVDAIASLRSERIVEVVELLSTTIAKLSTDTPADGEKNRVSSIRVAVAALNPHAGEAGLLGSEEIEIIAPAVAQARSRGFDVYGPLPADTLFRRAVDGEFDGVVSLFHDQALIPLKLLGVGESTNVTLGLSLPRTSPDHGTAYDLIGKPDSIQIGGMAAALAWAWRLSV